MLKHIQDPQKTRELLLALLPVSGTLAGICIAALGLVNFKARAQEITTITDDLLGFTALGFLICCYLMFWALSTPQEARLLRLARLADGLFLIALTALVAVGFLILYTVV